MKKLGLIFAFVFGASLAQAARNDHGTYVCDVIKAGRLTPTPRFTLKMISPTRAPEGKPTKYLLEYQQHGRVKSAVAIAVEEDVMFQFHVPGKSISGMIYMDEMDQTTIEINGVEARYSCEYLED